MAEKSVKVKYKEKTESKKIKLGGLLADLKIDISEKDIEEARHEMWDKFYESSK
ncbi:MAG: hypothetical protein ACE5IR_00665 [bacterium]